MPSVHPQILLESPKLGGRRTQDWQTIPALSLCEKTKWLIEERLGWAVDDSLPRKLRRQHFVQNRMHAVIKHAEKTKGEDALFRSFSSVAYLGRVQSFL